MITVPALKVRQFRMEFYQVLFSSADVGRLVEFVVLDSGVRARKGKERKKKSPVKWELLERLVKTGDTAYQRPLIRKKLEGLAEYYSECSEEDRVPLPAIPGAVILVSRQKLDFVPSGSNPDMGLVQIPEQEGILHALDGQHRLVALRTAHLPERAGLFQVPAVIFDTLEPRQEVEMFATINCKQTKLKPSLLVNLSGKRLYASPREILAHEVARKLNTDDASPLCGEIKMLGVGKGRISQASLTSAIIELLSREPALFKNDDEARQFLVAYFKQLGRIFRPAWEGRKYKIKTPIAIRAFLLAAQDVIFCLKRQKESVTDAIAIRRVIQVWDHRVSSDRFRTEGEWDRKLAMSARKSAELLSRELIEALKLEEEE